MGRLARLREPLNRISRPSEQTRRLLPPAAGIVAGVLLIATGLALVQAAGVVLIGLGLLLARGWIRIADAWWSSPADQVAAIGLDVRERAPSWAWPATVAAAVLVAAVMLGREIVRDGELNGRTLGDAGKGAIGLAMMATLALWSAERRPGRIGRRFGRWGEGDEGDPAESASEAEAGADT